MNLLELFSALLPVSAASISLIGSIVGAVITSGFTRGLQKENHCEIRLDGYNEEELKKMIELLEKTIKEKEESQTDKLSVSDTNDD